MPPTIDQRVRTLVFDLFLGGAEIPLDDDTNFVRAGICDSLGLVSLASSLEREFPGLEIQDQDVDQASLGSVAAIVRFLGSRGIAG